MIKPSAQYSHIIPINTIRTSEAVITVLAGLERLIASSDLTQVVFFNRAYLIVTKRISQAKTDGLFDNPKQMVKLEVAFAIKYFEALNNYVKHGSLPGAWGNIKQSTWYPRHPASLSLLLGANAHINYDLPLALKKTIEKPEEFRNDYFKVNRLLKESSKEISKSYYESDRSINFLKKNLRTLYLKPIMWLILRWRTRAWQKLANPAEHL